MLFYLIKINFKNQIKNEQQEKTHVVKNNKDDFFHLTIQDEFSAVCKRRNTVKEYLELNKI